MVSVSSVAADALVLKHQAISIHNADSNMLFQNNFIQGCHYTEQTYDKKFILKNENSKLNIG